jgi:hypothetical protein
LPNVEFSFPIVFLVSRDQDITKSRESVFA